jgi:hypothetical protein
MYQGYDIIGDVHGCGKTLIKLLEQMGYSKKNGVYQHSKRKVVFLGDIIDRGPNIRLACQIVYDMVTQGHAKIVMGNHEYNLITYCASSPKTLDRPFLRERTVRNNFIVEETLNQFSPYPDDFKHYLKWFSSLPLFLEFEYFRVVHACWDQSLIDEFVRRYSSNRLTQEHFVESADKDSFLYQFVDRTLRGTSLKLPDNRSMTSKDGMTRRFFRTKFWTQSPSTYADVVFQPDPLPDDLKNRDLTPQEKKQLINYSNQQKPLFFGHYWMSGLPKSVKPNLACLDYSAVKYGRLVSYRMDKEKILNNNKFTWARVDKIEN